MHGSSVCNGPQQLGLYQLLVEALHELDSIQ